MHVGVGSPPVSDQDAVPWLQMMTQALPGPSAHRAAASAGVDDSHLVQTRRSVTLI